MFNKLMRKLNGHAVEASSLAEALEQLARDREATQAELATLNAKRRQLLLDDATDAALDTVERSIDRANIRLEKIGMAEGPLQEQLATASAAERSRRWTDHVDAHRAAAAEFLTAARLAVAKHAALIGIVQAASREGFAREIPGGMPSTPNVNGHPICDPAALDQFERALTPAPRAPGRAARGGIQHYSGQPGASRYDPTRASSPRQATLAHPVFLDVMSGRELGVAVPKRGPRLPDDDAPLGAAEVRCIVVRAGFQSADGPSHAGRRIRLERAAALVAARGGAIEITEDPVAAAIRADDRTFHSIGEAHQ